jgi:hypothetical protein
MTGYGGMNYGTGMIRMRPNDSRVRQAIQYSQKSLNGVAGMRVSFKGSNSRSLSDNPAVPAVNFAVRCLHVKYSALFTRLNAGSLP